jgi:hypothetical protein
MFERWISIMTVFSESSIRRLYGVAVKDHCCDGFYA